MKEGDRFGAGAGRTTASFRGHSPATSAVRTLGFDLRVPGPGVCARGGHVPRRSSWSVPPPVVPSWVPAMARLPPSGRGAARASCTAAAIWGTNVGKEWSRSAADTDVHSRTARAGAMPMQLRLHDSASQMHSPRKRMANFIVKELASLMSNLEFWLTWEAGSKVVVGEEGRGDGEGKAAIIFIYCHGARMVVLRLGPRCPHNHSTMKGDR